MPTALSTVPDWIDENLTKLGCTTEQRFEILSKNIDWHDIKRLVDKGCSITLAIAILS